MQRTPVIAGNWKMHLDKAGADVLAREVATAHGGAAGRRCVVFPTYVHLETVRAALMGSGVVLGAQNCHEAEQGAFTGEVAAAMLEDLGVGMVLVGHSERRHVFGESDDRIAAKVAAVLRTRMEVMICLGETLAEREADRTFEVLGRQVQAALGAVAASDAGRLSLAYEPVWAIGTGRTATAATAQEAHAEVRRIVGGILGAEVAAKLPVLYGGSVKAENAAELLAQPDVDGALVGGASLKIDSFGPILAAASAGQGSGIPA
ncbi:MAG TPA: triose-phosphate isomerase [Planctomycetota bacterium]